MNIEFFYLRIEKYFFKDRSEEKKCRAFKILDKISKSPGSLHFHIIIGF